MAPKQLGEKLDHMSEEDLGIPFQEARLWSQVESRLNRKSRAAWVWRVAAVLLLALVSIPVSMREQSTIMIPVADLLEVDKKAVEPIEKALDASASTPPERAASSENVKDANQRVHQLTSKKIDINLAAVSLPTLERLPIQSIPSKTSQPLFAAKDISNIQASLENKNVEQGRNMTIRAQWQKSSTKSNVEYQALKIKLYEKNE